MLGWRVKFEVMKTSVERMCQTIRVEFLGDESLGDVPTPSFGGKGKVYFIEVDCSKIKCPASGKGWVKDWWGTWPSLHPDGEDAVFPYSFSSEVIF